MSEFLHSIAAAIRLAVVIGGSGVVFAFGFAVICRWLKWAPVSITVNVQGPALVTKEPSGERGK